MKGCLLDALLHRQIQIFYLRAIAVIISVVQLFAVGKWCLNEVVSTSMRRNHEASMLIFYVIWFRFFFYFDSLEFTQQAYDVKVTPF